MINEEDDGFFSKFCFQNKLLKRLLSKKKDIRLLVICYKKLRQFCLFLKKQNKEDVLFKNKLLK